MLIFYLAVMVVDLMADGVMRVVRRSNLLRNFAWVDHLFYPPIGLHYFVNFAERSRVLWMNGLCVLECSCGKLLRMRYLDGLTRMGIDSSSYYAARLLILPS